ncbi:hypothetical protein EI555_001690 [Monodon monoceros]|uniref:CARD domain-containing protein n=1 Tax=Monodon monoceros TaxID=40151 RepID=A0A4U1FDQ4_MONMO|nr:hypothetical protein EI555_001690 [Monodon monoceros]
MDMDGTSWKSSLKSPGQLMTKHSEHIDSASTHCLEAGKLPEYYLDLLEAWLLVLCSKLVEICPLSFSKTFSPELTLRNTLENCKGGGHHIFCLTDEVLNCENIATGENYKTVNDIVSALINAEDEKREEKEKTEETASDDLSFIRRNRMALFQQLMAVLHILDNLLKANLINKQEHDIIKQKTQIPLQARELIDTVLVKGNCAANLFKNCLKEIDSTLHKNLFVEKNMKYIPTDVSEL